MASPDEASRTPVQPSGTKSTWLVALLGLQLLAGGSLYLDGYVPVGLPWFGHRRLSGLGRWAGSWACLDLKGCWASLSFPGVTWSLDLLSACSLLSPNLADFLSRALISAVPQFPIAWDSHADTCLSSAWLQMRSPGPWTLGIPIEIAGSQHLTNLA